MIRRWIKVKTQFAGQHNWPEAPDEVAFLRSLHRHMFYVEVKIAVDYQDREIEFFIFKRHIDECIERLYPDCTHVGVRNLDRKSCETIADQIYYNLVTSHSEYDGRDIIISVSEDGEVAGEVEHLNE